MGKIRAQLGKVIPYHLDSRYRYLFPRRFRWKCYTTFLECKYPTKVLLLMKGRSAMFLFVTLYVVLITCMNIRQNLGHAWFLGPHTLGKLIFLITCLNIEQNLGHAWLLRAHNLCKFIFLIIYLNIEQYLGHAWLLKTYTLRK